MPILKTYISAGTADGRQVKVTATATPGATIHTSAGKDEIWLNGTNTDTVERVLTLEWGGTTSPDDLKKFTIPAGVTIPLVRGEILASGLIVKAFADSANKICIGGFVHRIS